MGGEDIPKVLGKDVSDEEINIVPAVCFAAGILGLNHKMWPRRRQGQNGFDLNAPEGFFDADDNVVAITVAPGLGNGETQVGSLAHEGKLGEFAAAFRVEFGRM